MEEKRELLRHTLATIAYRAARAIDGAAAGFETFAGAGRKPVQILAHMGDLFDWALSMAEGNPAWHSSAPLAWNDEVQRFFAVLKAFDSYLASDKRLHAPAENLMQGPLADALTHVGQLAMLRRLAGCPTRGEDFYVADVRAGRVGLDQPAPVKTF
jgi:hypothetical protein